MKRPAAAVSSLHCMAPGTYWIRMDEWMDRWMGGTFAVLAFLGWTKICSGFSISVTKKLNEIFGQPNMSTLIQSIGEF